MTRGTILIVDDNAALADNLQEILQDASYRVTTAGSVTAAERAAEEPFDVALLDVHLPDGDGTQLALRLREIAPDSQVIFLTGYASTESAAAAVRAGAFAYLVKPVASGDLLLTVEQATERVRQSQERRELARRAQRAEKLAAVGTLAAGLSHEIKNPLNAASLQLLVLERRLKKLTDVPVETFAPLALVQAEIHRLAAFLDEFLQFARPRDLQRAPTDVGALLREVTELLQPQAQAAQVLVDSRIEALPLISVDEARIRQSIMNLVVNAIQAAPAGSTVHIEAQRDGNEVVITVADAGSGVPPAVRDRIFEPFFSTKSAGTGLGLPTVHAIVQQHGGTIALEPSEQPGARFVVRLPIEA